MRILLLTHYYEPEVGAPQRRWRNLVEQFVDAGHVVAVCAPVAHYPHRRASDLAGSRVESYGESSGVQSAEAGGRKLMRWSRGVRGESILRVPYVPLSGTLAGQMIDQAASSAVMTAVAVSMRRARPDVIISTTPGLPMPFAASTAARWLRVPHIAEVRDAWPDLITDSQLVSRATGGRLPRILSQRLEQRLLPGIFNATLRTADAVVTTTEGFSERLRSRGIEPVVTIRNTSEVSSMRSPAPARRERGASLHMLYVGTVGRAQGLETAIRAVAGLPGIRLRIVGAGAEQGPLQRLAAQLTDRIEFFPQTTGRELDEHWTWAHTGLVSLSNVPAYEVTVPSKLVATMARRVHVTGVLAGEAAAMLRDSRGGSSVPPGDETGLRHLLIRLRDDPDSTTVDDYPVSWLRSHASPQNAAARYLDLLEEVVR